MTTPPDPERAALLDTVRRLQAHVATLRDELAERVRAEDERLETVVRQMPVGVVIVEGGSRQLLMVNDQASRLLRVRVEPGARLDDYFSRWQVRLVDGLPVGPEQWPLTRALVAGEATAQTLELDFGDARATFEFSAAPIRGPDGSVVRAVLTFGDVTERLRAQQERERLLASEQAARRDAEAASRAKDEFLATLSHELRTPISAMLGWVELLRGETLPPDVADRAVERIGHNARLQLKLIEDLLDVSRIVSGKLRMNVRPLALGAVVEAAADAVRLAAAAKGIRLECACEASLPLVLGDPDRLQQVVWNLLANAIKFTPGGGRVEVRTEREGEQARIRVVDTGQGIEGTFLPHVFERFRQADGSASRLYEGLGLGLAIVRHLVEVHGGTVEAASGGRGQGATFTVRLPLATASSVAPAPAATAGGRDPEVSLRGLRVLLVDNDADGLEVTGELLGRLGASVTPARSAAEALAILERTTPDVLVSDLGMPTEDGYALIRKVRAHERGRRLPAIAVTAYARREDEQLVLGAGFDAYLAKPVAARELAATVGRLARARA